MSEMRYRVNATIIGSKCLGEFEADNPEQAIAKALQETGSVRLCHSCAEEIIDPEVTDVTAEADEPAKAEKLRERCNCCDRGDEYNGFGSGPLTFVCPKHCSCHD